MKDLNLKNLGEKITEAFINQNQFVFAKVITDLKNGDVSVGDWFNYLMCDPKSNPPIFYQVSSPFDMVSKKAPQHALVFQNGKCILQTSYTDYAAMRTGILDALVLKSLDVKQLSDKKVLICGAGKTASWSLKGLKAYFPDLKEITYLTTESKRSEFEDLAKTLGVKAHHTTDNNPSEYDIILCHTNTKDSIFKDPTLIKPGAILTGFISSTPYGEFCDDFYNSDLANILIDWDMNLPRMGFIERAVTNGKVKKEEIVDLKDLFKGSYVPKANAKYTLFTSIGTPIQNIALLKMLVEDK